MTTPIDDYEHLAQPARQRLDTTTPIVSVGELFRSFGRVESQECGLSQTATIPQHDE